MIDLKKLVPNTGFLMGSTVRGLDDSAIEEIYHYLFYNLRDDRSVPSTIRISEAQEDLIAFISDEKRFTKIAFTKDYNPRPTDFESGEEEPRFKEYYDDDNLYYYVVKSSLETYPILIRLAYSSPTKIYFSASSYDQNALLAFYEEVKRFAKKEDNEETIYFGVLCSANGRMDVKKFPLDDKHSIKLDLPLNYGDGFEKHHTNIVSRLTSNRHGIIIFHGKPGTGKTTYIKHLASVFGTKRQFIFVPTTFIDSLVSPNIIPVLLDHKDSVLVLEDAEKAVVARNNQQGNESLVSALLNIGDGIMGSILNLSMIVSFNTDKENVDEALLRKGRLLYEHSFDKLSKEDSQRLLNKLNKNYTATEAMSLADIYNVEVETNHKKEEARPIGFGR